jgi:hypothetical protein
MELNPIRVYSQVGTGDFDASEIFVSINGVLYSHVQKVFVDEEQNVYYYGAEVTENIKDFSVYPFSIMLAPDLMPDIYQFVAETNADVDLKIWLEDPDPVYPDPVPVKKIFSADLTGNGQINHFRARFACGENGTLHLRPYVILNGNIRVDLCNFAAGGDQYIAGDNEEIEFDCYVPIETHAVAYVEAENTGEYPSLVDAAMTVQYEDFIESESIVGYEGVNLRRGRR